MCLMQATECILKNMLCTVWLGLSGEIGMTAELDLWFSQDKKKKIFFLELNLSRFQKAARRFYDIHVSDSLVRPNATERTA